AAAARAQRDIPAPGAQIAEVYRNYEKIKTAAQVLDFDDLLLHTTAVLEEHDAVAQEFRDRYRCFVVDEYQDVTPLQQRLLDAWLGAAVAAITRPQIETSTTRGVSSGKRSEPLRFADGPSYSHPEAGDTGVARGGARRVQDHRVQRLQPTGSAVPRTAQARPRDGAAPRLPRARSG